MQKKVSRPRTSDPTVRVEKYNPTWLQSVLVRWGRIWGVPDFGKGVKVVFNSRLRRSLGRCDLAGRTIRLNQICITQSRDKLLETLCHEAAHIAIHDLYGAGPRPHGVEWQRLMTVAGFEPHVTTRCENPSLIFTSQVRNRPLYQHRCPVCQTARTSSRPIGSWRCAGCVAAGLDGRLIITRVAKGKE